MSDLIKTEDPIVMEVSGFVMLHQKLNQLASKMRSKDEADTETISIECYTKQTEDKTESIVRFITSDTSWFEINTFKKFGGAILDANVTVNLYDLFVFVDNCREQMMSFWIDDTANELVMSAFFIAELDYDEFEVRIPIHNRYFGISNIDKPVDDAIAIVRFSAMFAMTALRELNLENKCDNIHFKFIKGKLVLMAEYNGLISLLSIKEQDRFDYGDQVQDFVIPFGLFFTMVGTGDLGDICLNVYDYVIRLNCTEYTFQLPFIKSELSVDSVSANITEDSIPVTVINTKYGKSAVDKLLTLGESNPYNIINYEIADKGIVDLYIESDRMKVYNRISAATLSDIDMAFDGDVLAEIFKICNVTELGIHVVRDGVYYIKYENSVCIKELIYDHTKFIEYRKSCIDD